jgi:glycosyltransferase involved in cell wall biosynthesis
MRERDDQAALSCAPPSILTTHHKRQHPEWTGRTVLLPGWYEAFERANLSSFRSFWWALRLFRESRQYDAVVTGAEHCGMIFAMLQTLLRPASRRRAHVMIDFPWAARPGRLRVALKVLQMRIAAPSLDAIFAHASPEEAERFTSALRVRKGLFRFVPFHYWMQEPLPETKRGDYIFSGGNYGRDYATLLASLADIPRRAIICTQTGQGLGGAPVPEHVQITGVSDERFHELMAEAAVVVVPLMKDDIHPGGHTVVVSAMALAKPIILAAPAEYRSYIDDGRTGVLTPPGDSSRLRAAIERVLSDDQFAMMLGRNAKADSTRFTPEIFFKRVFECVDCAVAEKRKARQSSARSGSQ